MIGGFRHSYRPGWGIHELKEPGGKLIPQSL